MNQYKNQTRSAYGLCIQSEIDLRDLPVVSGQPDVQITNGSVELPSSDCGTGEYSWGWCWCGSNRNIYGFSKVGRFDVQDGRSIIVDPIAEVDAALLRHVLLGPVFAGLLLQRGHLPLHANAQKVENKVVGIVGPSGAGKSTLSATLYARKHQLVSDDILATKDSGTEIIVPPGVPRIKLYPDISKHLKLDIPSKDRIYPDSEKQSFIATSDILEKYHRLQAIYAIEEGAAINVDQIEPRLAIIQLLGHVYRPDVVSSTLGRQDLFQRCAQLAARIPIYAFSRPRDLDQLNESTTVLEEHIAALPSNDH